MMTSRILFISALLISISRTAVAFTVSVNTKLLGFEAGRTSGHEEITRQAMNRLESSLTNIGIDVYAYAPELLADREADLFGTKGFSAHNRIIQGNYATDMPEAWSEVFSLPIFYGEPASSWQSGAKVQFLHFLRNRNADGTLVSQLDTCRQAREQITQNTITGVKLWRMGLKRAALFLFGHSSHTIQDSFSPAHTIRADTEHNNDVLKVCYYGLAKNPGADTCYHLPVDPRDGIWIRGPLQLAKTLKTFPHEDAAIVPYVPVITSFIIGPLKESSLKYEARLARTATLRYFYVIAAYLNDYATDDPEFKGLRKILMENLFEGRTGVLAVDQGLAQANPGISISMPKGIIRCDQLDPNASALVPSESEILDFRNSTDDPQSESHI
jgi:hypothetical protein